MTLNNGGSEMEMLLPGNRVENKFCVTNWSNEKYHVDVLYYLSGSELTVNVNGAGIDDIDSVALLQFLQSNGVIDNAESWKVKEVQDTDGLTYIDATYTSFTLVRR